MEATLPLANGGLPLTGGGMAGGGMAGGEAVSGEAVEALPRAPTTISTTDTAVDATTAGKGEERELGRSSERGCSPFTSCTSSIVEGYAFDPQAPTYSEAQVPLWITTRNGSRLPAFHIDNGSELTMLISHSNAEDIGVVFTQWKARRLDSRMLLPTRALLRLRTATSAPATSAPATSAPATSAPATSAPATSAPASQDLSRELDVNALAYDYSGFGHATGQPSEANLHADASAALELLVTRFGLRPETDVRTLPSNLSHHSYTHRAAPTSCYARSQSLARSF